MSRVTIVSGRHGVVGEWMFHRETPGATSQESSWRGGLQLLEDTVLPVFLEAGLFSPEEVVVQWRGGASTRYATLPLARAAIEAAGDGPAAAWTIAVHGGLACVDAGRTVMAPRALRILWQWPGSHSIQVKVLCDAVLPFRIDGTPNAAMAEVNGPRLERALAALAASFDPDIEIGDDEMPWAKATGFRLDNRRETDGSPIDGRLGFPPEEFVDIG